MVLAVQADNVAMFLGRKGVHGNHKDEVGNDFSGGRFRVLRYDAFANRFDTIGERWLTSTRFANSLMPALTQLSFAYIIDLPDSKNRLFRLWSGY